MAPLELILTAAVTAAACAVPGVFLVLRRQAMASDAIGHVILPGIVLGVFLTGTLHSPFVIIAATLMGILAIAGVEAMERSGLVRGDAALGMVYPALFSIGVILISMRARSLHLDVDAVLMGELATSTLRKFVWMGYDFGPWSLVVMSAVLVINSLFVFVFYKELKITTFDPAHAASVGFPPSSVHYALMTLVALTVVAAYDAAGAILVVAFIVAPTVTAYLLTDRLGVLIGLAILIAVLGAWGGVELAVRADANVAGSVAAMFGVLFAVVFMLAPRYGLAAKSIQRAKFAREFECGLLVVHLAHHEKTPAASEENRADQLEKHLNWPATRVERVLRRAKRRGWTQQVGPLVVLTDHGRTQAKAWVKPQG